MPINIVPISSACVPDPPARLYFGFGKIVELQHNKIKAKEVLEDERKGEKVVSWHSKFLWDSLKNRIKNSDDALLLSKLMRKNMAMNIK